MRTHLGVRVEQPVGRASLAAPIGTCSTGSAAQAPVDSRIQTSEAGAFVPFGPNTRLAAIGDDDLE